MCVFILANMSEHTCTELFQTAQLNLASRSCQLIDSVVSLDRFNVLSLGYVATEINQWCGNIRQCLRGNLPKGTIFRGAIFRRAIFRGAVFLEPVPSHAETQQFATILNAEVVWKCSKFILDIHSNEMTVFYLQWQLEFTCFKTKLKNLVANWRQNLFGKLSKTFESLKWHKIILNEPTFYCLFYQMA